VIVMPRADRAIIPFRWVGHHVDICAVHTEYEVRFIARDVLDAVGLDVDATLGAQPTHEGFLDEHADATAWSLDEITTVIAPIASTSLARDLMTWLRARAAEVDAMRQLTREVPQRPPVLLSSVDPAAVEAPATAVPVQEPRTWSVAQTARILSRDPSIEIGQQGLFDWMHLHGWIDRRADAWLPTTIMTTLGWLGRLDRRIPGHTDLYPQVLITVDGVHALHQRLGGTADLDLNRHHLMLVEDGDTQ
jgi:hypothetical protein